MTWPGYFGQIVIGPPGSGKSTYCHGLQQFMNALRRPALLINLDPAIDNPVFPHDISITDLVSLKQVMNELHLGPNGAMLYCLEFLETNLDWLLNEIESAAGKMRKRPFIVIDTPGQAELSTDHGSLRKIVDRLVTKLEWRLAAVHLMDASHILDPAKYISILLLSLRTMLQLELPHINVLSKIDILKETGDLPFNLDFYTEVEDLSQLLPLLSADPRAKRFGQLNKTICDIIEDFGLVSFETLAVEDKESMMHLQAAIDKAIGYTSTDVLTMSGEETRDVSELSEEQLDEIELPPLPLSRTLHAQLIQERWIDHRETYDELERETWAQEGERARQEANEAEQRKAASKLEANE